MTPLQSIDSSRIRRGIALAIAVSAGLTGFTGRAHAQSLGTFRWRLEPYCNVLSIGVTQVGSQFRLEGTDDQCGAGKAAPLTGLATFNPDGSLGFGINIVTAPDGAPVHVSASLVLPGLSGTWSDSLGGKGGFTFWPGAASGGSPRPTVANATGDVTGVTAGAGLSGGGTAGEVALAVNPAVVQSRVSQGCPAGQAVRAIGQDGSVSCDVLLGGGDVTAVIAGAGLSGGGFFGNVDLAVQFGGSGAAPSAARSDHTHAAQGNANTAIGAGTLASLSSGEANVAVGSGAATSLSTGAENTAIGVQALNGASSAVRSTAVGRSALLSLFGGSGNVAIGSESLRNLLTGSKNVSVGEQALYCLGSSACAGGFDEESSGNVAVGGSALASLRGGFNNIAIGSFVGNALGFGSSNIYIGNQGTSNESGVIRIGTNGTHVAVGIAGIRGVQTVNNNAVNVVIDSTGHVGTTSSSRRFKDDIHDLGDIGLKLQSLRPVSFRYTQAYADGDRPTQYGLIAEEVEAVLPELVAYGADGLPESVKYHVLPSLLVAEVQRLERERAAQAAELSAIKADLSAMRASTATAAQTPTAVVPR